MDFIWHKNGTIDLPKFISRCKVDLNASCCLVLNRIRVKLDAKKSEFCVDGLRKFSFDEDIELYRSLLGVWLLASRDGALVCGDALASVLYPPLVLVEHRQQQSSHYLHRLVEVKEDVSQLELLALITSAKNELALEALKQRPPYHHGYAVLYHSGWLRVGEHEEYEIEVDEETGTGFRYCGMELKICINPDKSVNVFTSHRAEVRAQFAFDDFVCLWHTYDDNKLALSFLVKDCSVRPAVVSV
jgi:hypothetical protein